MSEPGISDEQIEAAVRRYVTRMARRYVPFALGALCFLLVVITVPTVGPKTSGSGNAALNTAGSNAGSTVGAGGQSSNGAPTGSAGTGPTGSGSGATGAGTSAGDTAGSTGGTGATVAQGITPPAPPDSAGVARSGAHCGPGARQVPWSAYAPLCEPAYSGDNGGATSRGVTASTITVAYRNSTSAEDQAVNAAAGAAAPAPDPQFVADMNTYINFFNAQFELYGRKVVLKPFNGQSDYIQEDQGGDAAQAQADAQTEAAMPAFADATFYLKASEVFQNAEAAQKVVSFVPLGLPENWFQAHAPYAYSFWTDGTKLAHWMSGMTCTRMSGLPAVFSSNTVYQKSVRKFGLVTPENPDYQTIGNQIAAGLSGCGTTLTKRVNYQIDVSTFETQASTLVAELQAAGVTTVLCYCDPLIPIFLSRSAASQNYYPEWVEPYYGDTQARLMDSKEWSSAISEGGRYPQAAQTEAYRVFKLANPTGQPAEQYYAVAYATVLHMMALLQAAGPDLTPQALEQASFNLPKSGPGDFNDWGGGLNNFTPFQDTSLAWWSGTAKSGLDGTAGAWQDCDNRARFSFANASSGWGAMHTQLHCFGK